MYASIVVDRRFTRHATIDTRLPCLTQGTSPCTCAATITAADRPPPPSGGDSVHTLDVECCCFSAVDRGKMKWYNLKRSGMEGFDRYYVHMINNIGIFMLDTFHSSNHTYVFKFCINIRNLTIGILTRLTRLRGFSLKDEST